jgi:predicted chitinase
LQDFVSNPDLLIANIEFAVESAFVFWFSKNINAVADSGTVSNVTQIVNGGQNGYVDRRLRFNSIAPILLLSEEK